MNWAMPCSPTGSNLRLHREAASTEWGVQMIDEKPELDKREYEDAQRARIMREFDLLKLKRAELSEAQMRAAEQEERPQRTQQERGPGSRHERRAAAAKARKRPCKHDYIFTRGIGYRCVKCRAEPPLEFFTEEVMREGMS
jgi:hypothetical protein